MNVIKLEVCVDSIESAKAAYEGGATRIELCTALSEGGLTPTTGILKALKNLSLSIPIYCMLRPRSGNDFEYTSVELDALLTDLEILRYNGADGFVFGALNKFHSIDIEKCCEVIKKSAGLPVTFHRAFDLTEPSQMYQNVDLIKSIGFKRILSSGFRKTAFEGKHNLSKLIEKNNDFIIMPGGGVNVNNLGQLLEITKCEEFHSSAKDLVEKSDSSDRKDTVVLGTYEKTSLKVVQQLVTIARTRSTFASRVV